MHPSFFRNKKESLFYTNCVEKSVELCWHYKFMYVLINNHTTGYGIFIENMLDAVG